MVSHFIAVKEEKVTLNQSSASIPGISTKTPFTVLAVKRSKMFADQTAAKATAALRRKAQIQHFWPSHIARRLSVMHDGGFTFYVTWPDEIEQDVLDLELTGHPDYPKSKRNAIHLFVNENLPPLLKEYDLNIGWTVDQFVVGVF
jgi:hypothetical protein